jgi:hypothetical protein
MAVVTNLWMAAALGAFARESARGRPSAAGKRRLQYSSPTIAADLVEDCVPTCPARAFVAELLAAVLGVAAFQLATARTGANVLCLKVVAWSLGCRVQRAWLPPSRLSFGSFTLASAAVLSALVAAAVE